MYCFCQWLLCCATICADLNIRTILNRDHFHFCATYTVFCLQILCTERSIFSSEFHSAQFILRFPILIQILRIWIFITYLCSLGTASFSMRANTCFQEWKKLCFFKLYDIYKDTMWLYDNKYSPNEHKI